jgi:hypothetical protein
VPVSAAASVVSIMLGMGDQAFSARAPKRIARCRQ